MARDNVPCCLLCGDRMTVTTTTQACAGLTRFERQQLVCPNCGDLDSRFVFVAAGSQIPAPAPIELAEEIRTHGGADVLPDDLALAAQDLVGVADRPALAASAAPSDQGEGGERSPATLAAEKKLADLAIETPAAPEDAPSFVGEGRDNQSTREEDSRSIESVAAGEQAAESSPKPGGLLHTYLAKWRHHQKAN
jgi:hypothetical protein